MPERADHTIMDYIFNAQANTNPVGSLIPLSDTWGWSVQLFATGAATTGNLFFQFTDYDAISGVAFPFIPTNLFVPDSFNVALTVGNTMLRVGKAYDPLFNTPKWMRVSFNDGGSSAAARVYISVTLKHQ